MSINEDELRRLAEASNVAEGHWFTTDDLAVHNIVDPDIRAFMAAASDSTVLALLDTIAALRQELRTVIDADNALVQRQRQELDAANQRAKAAEAQARYGARLIATAIELHHAAGAGEAMAFLLDEVTKGLASVEVRDTTDAAR